ncbi:hypothetical protein LY76DRAFT_193432 [Colletotrichum caudatum]|nr:hypothetical protein LY76DRAFT_193432 [Colletotrichum caudatum]
MIKREGIATYAALASLSRASSGKWILFQLTLSYVDLLLHMRVRRSKPSWLWFATSLNTVHACKTGDVGRVLGEFAREFSRYLGFQVEQITQEGEKPIQDARRI